MPTLQFKSHLGTFRTVLKSVLHHVKSHVGLGIVCGVAYFDPGNWSVDLQAGANFGYRPMLFVLLLSGLGAMVLQTLACKLGCVTGIDLASHCRLLLHDHPTHPRFVRRMILYPLYICAEVAIISTDLAEVLGSAIGICLIFPSLPLWTGVVLTALDVFVFLLFSDPSRGQGKPVRVFELIIMTLVFAVFACFTVLLIRVHPHWSSVFMGYIPDKNLFQSHPNALYAAVGILGATIMPHALFLGSFLATQDREASHAPTTLNLPEPSNRRKLTRRLKIFAVDLFRITPAERAAAAKDYRSRYGVRENNPFLFIKQHLIHIVIDVCSSILVLAIPINSAILILSATVFFNQSASEGMQGVPIGLFDAHALIHARIGSGSAFLFALALVAAGQSSSITATLAGQVVGEGFIEWRVSPFLRRLLTRSISLVPSVVVAVAVGRDGIDNLLVISQVVLSVVLPFVAFPLIYLTSSEAVMRVRKPPPSAETIILENTSIHTSEIVATSASEPSLRGSIQEVEIEESSRDPSGKPTHKSEIEEISNAISINDIEYIDYSNSRLLSACAYLIWAVILITNVYTMVALGLGDT
ncbi:natural resistance-associated macrophage protein-domain-containing protein [Lentinula aff. detonsa]|uniref:Natural resistance-associated macrophage protein-domain-containing protein n=1 Tax=Lentinula aff. detonsa TaxID=2804958 RepID=A0AA38KG66_9AGAR|nr:natural resistance-associated macrophage protein-domain-containing protein [Lentinula aff. detonsa]